MVTSCAHWMLAGLPIHTFTVVLYTKADLEAAERQYARLVANFDSLKTTIDDLVKKQDDSEGGFSFDFYMSYSEKDKKYAQKFSQ